MTRSIALVLVAWSLAACGPGAPADFEGDDAGECADGADNDRDGAFDCDDSDCAASPACEGSTDAGQRDAGMDAGFELDASVDPDAAVDPDGAIDPDGGTDASVGDPDASLGDASFLDATLPDAATSDAGDASVPPDAPPPPPAAAFRLVTLTAEDPRPSANVIGCTDLTSFANALLEPQEHLIVFPSLERSPTMQPVQLVENPVCTTAGTTTTCGVDVDSVITEDVATTSGTGGTVCLAPVPATTAAGYVPAMPAHPCFSTEGARLEIQTEQDDIILHDVRIAARFVDGPPGTLVEGLLYGFLFEGVAMSVDFTVGGVDRTLWSILPGGGACSGGDQRETHMSMSGWWTYFHFTAERVEWAP